VTASLELFQGRYEITADLGDWKTHQDAGRILARWPQGEGLTALGPGAAPGHG
jgi:hypothetical protein